MRALLLLTILACAAARADVHPAISTDPVPDKVLPPSVEELTFKSQGQRLPGHLYLANDLGPHPTVVLLHGLPGNEKNLDIAQALRRAGFNVMFFHYRGAWGAEGNYSLSHLAPDVAAALDYLRRNATRYRVDTDKLSVLGHSMGGFAALAAGSRDPALACVGALAPVNLGLWAEGLRAGEPSAKEFLEYADTLFMLQGFDSAQMRKDLLSQPAMKLDTRLFAPGLRGKSVLLATGASDKVLPPVSMFFPVVSAYRRDPAIRLHIHTIPGDHSFSYTRIQLTELLLEWLESDCR